MTKRHEEFIRGFLSEILRTLKDRPSIKGECTLLISGFHGEKSIDMESIRNELKKALEKQGGGLSDITKKVAQKHGLSKKAVYEEALKLKGKAQDA
jgi:16S rRNA (cytidine1402-2'-O)-methyltransferase